MRTAAAAFASLILAGCSSAGSGPSAPDAAGWEPSDDSVSSIACSELAPEWTTDAEGAPEACWSYEETDGLEARFVAFTGELGEHLGSKPSRGPECWGGEGETRTMQCRAAWTDGSPVISLASGISLVGLKQALEAGVDYHDPTQPVLYEITVWETDEDFFDEVPGADYRPVGD